MNAGRIDADRDRVRVREPYWFAARPCDLTIDRGELAIGSVPGDLVQHDDALDLFTLHRRCAVVVKLRKSIARVRDFALLDRDRERGVALLRARDVARERRVILVATECAHAPSVAQPRDCLLVADRGPFEARIRADRARLADRRTLAMLGKRRTCMTVVVDLRVALPDPVAAAARIVP